MAEVADDRGAGRGVNRVSLVAYGDLAIVADADWGLLAPDIGPPRAFWGGTDQGWRNTVRELKFFIARKVAERWI